MKNSDYIIVGKVNGFHGVQGFVKVFSETRPRGAITQYDELYLKRNRGEWEKVEIERAREQSKNIVLKIKGFDDRDSVTPLLGAKLAILPEMLPELDEGEFYWAELIGLRVYNEEEQYIGVVDSLMETGANDVLVVSNPELPEPELIPYNTEYIIREVNLEEGILIADWDLEEP